MLKICCFSDTDRLSSGKEDNAAGDKKDAKDINVLAWNQY